MNYARYKLHHFPREPVRYVIILLRIDIYELNQKLHAYQEIKRVVELLHSIW